MPTPLQIDFERFTQTSSDQCENLTVIVDNAHIPLHCISSSGSDMECLSQSMSAINGVPYPPPFLNDTKATTTTTSCKSRWEDSFEGSCNSDLGMRIPARTDDVDEENTRIPPIATSSLDSTARWLRELPLEGSSASPDYSQRRKKPGKPPELETGEELPVLIDCALQGLETHPNAGIKWISSDMGTLPHRQTISPTQNSPIAPPPPLNGEKLHGLISEDPASDSTPKMNKKKLGESRWKTNKVDESKFSSGTPTCPLVMHLRSYSHKDHQQASPGEKEDHLCLEPESVRELLESTGRLLQFE